MNLRRIFGGSNERTRLNLYNLKSLQLTGQAAEFKLESKFEQLQVTWQSMKHFGECSLDSLGKIDSRDSGDRPAQTQGAPIKWQ